jgi:antitoxin (DNA-binding transcriptional repressor) of toxin-antitoxin stability system
MRSVTTHEAKSQLSKLLAEVESGQEVIIRRGNVAIAKLTAVRPRTRRTRPKVGTITSGPIRYSEDAFAPLDEAGLQDWGL